MTGPEQPGFALRFGWGAEDLERLAPVSDIVVLVDVLRFTTAVSVAVGRGATVFPYRWRDETAATFADVNDAELAGPRGDPSFRWSLSPTDLMGIPAGARLVLPSPNGAHLSVAAADSGAMVVAGSLRNAAAVGRYIVQQQPDVISVIAAGERWPDAAGHGTGPMRPAVEDLLGAGAVLSRVRSEFASRPVSASPEARAARAAFAAAADLDAELAESVSGHELIGRGWADDVRAAAALNVDSVVPVLTDGAYRCA
jgi:2-phosphosulfolactate phosphatase